MSTASHETLSPRMIHALARAEEEAVRTALHAAVSTWRRKTGLGYQEVAGSIGVSLASIYKWLSPKGGVRLPTHRVVAVCLAIGVDYKRLYANALGQLVEPPEGGS